RFRAGERIQVQSDFEDGDVIYFNGWELEDGEVKKDGLESNFNVLVERMNEEFRKEVLSRKVGDQLDYDLYQIEEGMSDDHVRKYLMQLESDEMDREVHPEFRLEIME